MNIDPAAARPPLPERHGGPATSQRSGLNHDNLPPAPLTNAIPIIIVALSGFLLGFDGSLFTGAVIFVERRFELGSLALGWTVASHTMTATLSIFLAGPFADRFGRRTVLRAAALIFAASSLVAAASTSFGMLIAARMLSGLGVGAVLVAAPMYIAEIAPPALRGRMVTFNQLFIVIGIFLASCSSFGIVRFGHLDLAHSGWRWMLGLGAVPAAAYLLALFAVPESPRWHAMRGRIEAARRILTRAHGAQAARDEVAAVRASLEHEAGRPNARLRDLLAPELRGVLLIGLVLAVLQQITGINAVLSYAPAIFERVAAAGAHADTNFLQTMFITFVNLVFTVVAMLLIDRAGRRPLLLAGTAGMAVSLLFTAYGFHATGGASHPAWVLAGLLGFVASFAVSIGPGMWVMLSEIFPNRVRGLAISCVGLVNSSVCFAAQQLFPWQMEHLGGTRTFFIYGVCASIGLVLLVRMLPETRGRSLEELEDRLVRRG